MSINHQPRATAVHTVIGLPDQVTNVIDNHRRAGILVAATDARPLSATDPRIRVNVRLRDTAVPAQPVIVVFEPGSYRPLWRGIGLALAITTAVVAFGYLVLYTAAAIIAAITEHLALIGGVLAITVTALGLLFRHAGGNRKRHCPGC